MTNLLPSQMEQEQTIARMRQLRQEQATLEQQMRVQQFAAHYETQFTFPAIVQKTDKNAQSPPRTDSELIQHRLLEAGILYEVPVTIGDTVQSVSQFIENLEQSGCFNAVRVQLGGRNESIKNEVTRPNEEQILTVFLDEKKWYKLYIGGGLKRDALQQNSIPFGSGTSDASFLPTAEVEASIGLRNVTGHLDTTDLQYTLDTHQISTWSLQHQRPLYSALGRGNALRDWILQLPAGSQYSLLTKAVWDTIDWEATRSFREFQRLLSVTACTNRQPETLPTFGGSIEWSVLFRDVVPRRHAALPYQFAASPEVLSHAGPSVKHSITTRIQSNVFIDSDVTPFFPTGGYQYMLQTEFAIPPGDVGFVKGQADVALHFPLMSKANEEPDGGHSYSGVTIHTMASAGFLKSFDYGGLCRPSAIFADRFLLGGPVNFRGFSPAGIGPRTRAAASGTSVPPGDALGGDFFYKLTGMVSTSSIPSLGMRLFAFGTVGTCTNIFFPRRQLSVVDILASSRLSAGVGIATTIFGPRLEITYAWPLRFGPTDHRRSFQYGMGFSLGG